MAEDEELDTVSANSLRVSLLVFGSSNLISARLLLFPSLLNQVSTLCLPSFGSSTLNG